MDDPILFWLLFLTTGLSVLLVLISSATLGRKLSDIEYQRAAGLNGVLSIQARINARTHANRVLLGLTFLLSSILTLADTDLLMRTWVVRVMFIAVILAYTVSSALDWLDERAQVHLNLAKEPSARRSPSALPVAREGSTP